MSVIHYVTNALAQIKMNAQVAMTLQNIIVLSLYAHAQYLTTSMTHRLSSVLIAIHSV